MKKSSIIRTMTAVVVSMSLLLTYSCVNKEYELSEDRINLDVTVFQDGLSVPLGSTSKIMLKDVKDSLLKNLEDTSLVKYFTVGANGEYGLAVSDRLELSDTLNSLLAQIEIPDIPFSEKFTFNLNTVDVSSLKVQSDEYSYVEKIGGIESPDLTFNDLGTDLSFAAGLHEYKPSDELLNVELDAFEYSTVFADLPEDFTVDPSMINDNPLFVDPAVGNEVLSAMNVSTAFGPDVCNASFSMSMPEGIKAVEDILLHGGAKVRVTVGLRNSLFTEGMIIPHIDMDVHEIFHMKVDENEGQDALTVDHILGDFNLPAAGGVVSKDYEIQSLVLSEEDWSFEDGVLVLNKDVDVVIEGELTYSEVYTTTRHIASLDDKRMYIDMSIEFVDFQVDDAKVTIGPIAVDVPYEKVSFSGSVELPEQVLSVGHVDLAEESRIIMSVVPENVPPGLRMELVSLDVAFPEGIEVEGASDGVMSFSDVDLTEGFIREMRILDINLPDPVDGVLLLEEEVVVNAALEVEGVVSSSALPATEEDDLRVKVNVQADIVIDDYSVTISGFDCPVEYAQDFGFEVTGLEEFGSVKVYPEGEPAIVIDVLMPGSGLEIIADPEENLVISFPEMLKFRDLPQEYNYNKDAGTVTLKGQLPSQLVLPVDYLVITPVEEDGKYWAKGGFKVAGGVAIPEGSVDKDDMAALADPECKVGMIVRIPEIRMGTIAMDQAYEKRIEKSFEIGVMSADQIPEEIVCVDRVELEDVFFNLCLDASQLPDLGSTKISLVFDVALPEMIVLDSDNVKDGNVLTVTGELDEEGKVAIEPVRIVALDLSEIDLRNPENLKEVVTIDGRVVLDDIALDVNEWLGKSLEVNVEGGIKDIEISKVSGKVDFQIEPVEAAVGLVEVKEFLETDNIEIHGIENFLARLNLAADIKTNVGVPMGARMVITPYSGGVAVEDSIWETELTLNHSQSASDTTHTRYWLSSLEKDQDVYVPAGYTHIHFPLKDYLSNIPDSLAISIEAGTDPSVSCVIEPSHEYIVEAAYSLEVPFEFGEGCTVTYRDTIPDLPEIVGQLLAMGDLVLTGEITSNLPIEVDMKVDLLDLDGNRIALDESASWQKIEGCTPDGEPGTTELYLGLQKKDATEVNGVSAIELEFNLATVAGVPLSDHCFLQASLQALVPNGVSMDVNELMNENEEEE